MPKSGSATSPNATTPRPARKSRTTLRKRSGPKLSPLTLCRTTVRTNPGLAAQPQRRLRDWSRIGSSQQQEASNGKRRSSSVSASPSPTTSRGPKSSRASKAKATPACCFPLEPGRPRPGCPFTNSTTSSLHYSLLATRYSLLRICSSSKTVSPSPPRTSRASSKPAKPRSISVTDKFICFCRAAARTNPGLAALPRRRPADKPRAPGRAQQGASNGTPPTASLRLAIFPAACTRRRPAARFAPRRPPSSLSTRRSVPAPSAAASGASSTSTTVSPFPITRSPSPMARSRRGKAQSTASRRRT